ncbi:NAD-glutamate dehydrogenase [Ramlibacter monticola]|uniref:NAD-glutamate dehydrogenase n=1 Tax=Ramlibacter monticola TaxID=1926872 RepID=A0A936Z4B6_9BURK|nr:NAD-glutamate dehydrogenase [Ramlibacter monticola]MBL0394648.1 NAD-glutamate dehydrogenase [Ramlibacter monticola]
MTVTTENQREERIAAVLALAASRPGQAAAQPLNGFGHEYFRQVDVEDLDERTPEDLLGALLSHWQFGAQRQPGAPKVRVFSPSPGEDGWGSRHTIVEIVNDDMPFLVDSVSMEIHRQGLALHLLVHPVYAVQRDAKGSLQSIAPRASAPELPRESWMYIEVDRLVDAEQRANLCRGIERVLADVRAAVSDWKPMQERLREASAELASPPANVSPEEAAESRAFLDWLADGHFTMLGYRQHDLVEEGEDLALKLVPGSALGVLRETADAVPSASFAALPPAARAMARTPSPVLVVTKANTRSTVHRDGYTDYLGVKRFDAQGRVLGEHRFIGLFTSTMYSARVSETPLLRRKVEAIAQRAGFAPQGHLAKALQHTLETFPRDDLFQIPEDELYDIVLGILAVGERHRLRLFAWKDPFGRFVSCLVFVPREAFSTQLRLRFQRILLKELNGSHIDFDVLLSGTQLARIHFNVRIAPKPVPAFDRKDLERKLAAAARRWDDELREALVDAEGEAAGLALERRWASGFPVAYREQVPARAAVHDIRKIAALTPEAPFALALYWPLGAAEGRIGLKVYRLGAPVILSDSLPMLEHMGVRVLAEDNHRIQDADNAQPVWLHDFALQARPNEEIEQQALARLFEDAFARVFRGEVENDDFNRLVLLAGLSAEEVVVLRAYAKYLKQVGFAASQATIASTLEAHPRIARMLVSLFRLRFDPQAHDEQAAASQVNALNQALDKVSNLSEDRVLRQLVALVQATLRTNYWRTGVGASGAAGARRPFLSFKFDSHKVPGLPEPRPLYEIWVYSPRFEGIHLRGGKVARGGLRWSDRPDDFRTEVLGLVKAQMVKNTVIVPTGSKGGFVLKKAPPASDREAFMKEGVACYQEYLRGLLDLTDNLVAGKPVPPPQVVRIDGEDPYLVVAADKGTATFSDYANAVSIEYGHWLGDAFASGGSQGYDHKEMGITARGAWESVKRHFRELGLDTQSTDFTVVGVGDMSGDVFGNGMLLSKHIRLVAAFDHRHIFIDPDPQAESSFAERKRMFELPRSSWADYDTKLISEGGGVWARSEKSVAISPQARRALGIEAESLTPAELMTAILKAPVDLLYNGGIGTYVKAASQANADVGDRANDAVRINGGELRCRVVGEGGNLGFTQRGRIEAAQKGVKLYTDAIDNSAGVDTSDHEVNIKILLGLAQGDGELTEKQRNTLMPQMTDEVAALVLRDNYFQSQALSIGGRLARRQLEDQARFIRFLEKKGELNRAIEFLPSEEEIAERAAKGLGLTHPERAVLLAYSKMWLNDELLASDLPEDPWVARALERYFPALLKEKFGAWIPRHPLRREIIATHVLNSMVNRVGPTFVHRQGEITGATPPQVVRAYLATREVFGLVGLWQQIEALDNLVPDEVQADMVITLRGLLTRSTTWFLRSRRLFEPTEQQVARFAPAVKALRGHMEGDAPESARAARWVAAGVPRALAVQVDNAEALFHALDVAEIAEQSHKPLELTAQVHAGVGERLGLARMRQQIEQLPADTFWHELAKVALSDDLNDLQRSIARQAFSHEDGEAGQVLDRWEQGNRQALERAQRLLQELRDTGTGDLAMLSVALRELRNLV